MALITIPVNYGTEADYEAYKTRQRQKWEGADEKWVKAHFDAVHPLWRFNDIAGFVELAIDRRGIRYVIFAASSPTPPHRWRHDRRMTRRYTWLESGHWSLRRCRTRTQYLREVERCLRCIRALIPSRFVFTWDSHLELLQALEWRRLTG